MLKVFIYNNGETNEPWTVINWKTKRVILKTNDIMLYNCERTVYKGNKGFVGICLPTTPDTLYHYKLTLQNGKRVINSIPKYSIIYFNKEYPKGFRRMGWDNKYLEYTEQHLKDFCSVKVWQTPDYYEDDNDDEDDDYDYYEDSYA